MVDREKVIKGLEACRLETIKCEDSGCLYIDSRHSYACFFELHADALALLKAKEPVKPVVDIDTWKCGNCGHTLEHQQLLGDNVLFHEQYNYCPECGRAVKWE